MRTIDKKFYELCDEIDDWKAEAKYWENKYEEEKQLNIDTLNRDLERSQKGIASALMFALSVKDYKDGNLVIEKKDRKIVADSFRNIK